jgi:hypothetical protein
LVMNFRRVMLTAYWTRVGAWGRKSWLGSSLFVCCKLLKILLLRLTSPCFSSYIAVLLSMHLRSFFIVQLSSMITGWCAIAALAGPLPKGTSVFSAVLLKVAGQGTGQAVLSALLLSSGREQGQPPLCLVRADDLCIALNASRSILTHRAAEDCRQNVLAAGMAAGGACTCWPVVAGQGTGQAVLSALLL